MYVVLLYQPSHIEFSKHFFFHDDDTVEKNDGIFILLSTKLAQKDYLR